MTKLDPEDALLAALTAPAADAEDRLLEDIAKEAPLDAEDSLLAQVAAAEQLKEPGPRGPRGPQGNQGERGPAGPIPAHEWDGTKLRIQNADGSFDEGVDLRGPRGPRGHPGAGGGAPSVRWSYFPMGFG